LAIRRSSSAALDSIINALSPVPHIVTLHVGENAKQTPLTEDRRRVIVGIGRVLKIEPHVEYSYESKAPRDALRSILWERNVHHSIRLELRDGFLLPYHEILELAANDKSIDPAEFVLHAANESWSAFSMGGEHVTHDQAITVLISCVSLLEKIERVVPGDWKLARNWVDGQLNRIWKLRGAFPGMGSALSALGDRILVRRSLTRHGESSPKSKTSFRFTSRCCLASARNC
jgi:hypothetical protein